MFFKIKKWGKPLRLSVCCVGSRRGWQCQNKSRRTRLTGSHNLFCGGESDRAENNMINTIHQTMGSKNKRNRPQKTWTNEAEEMLWNMMKSRNRQTVFTVTVCFFVHVARTQQLCGEVTESESLSDVQCLLLFFPPVHPATLWLPNIRQNDIESSRWPVCLMILC